jgi:hypothetical protein
MQDRVARTLGESANALDAAARSLKSEIRPPDAAALLPSATGGAHANDELELERLRESEAIAAQIAEELGQALRGFTEQVQRIDKTMDALRLEIHEESRLRKETPAAEPVRAAKPASALVPRDRSGAPSPGDRIAAPAPAPVQAAVPALAAPAGQAAHAAQAKTPAAPPAHAPAPVPPLPRVDPQAPPAARREPTNAPPAPAAESSGADVASVDGPIGRELSLSGFRVGAPRAQGPDPYERLASGFEPPSNVRHFPTRERELGDELKLSGLLGPSVPRSGATPPAPAGQTAGPSPRPAPAPPERRPEPQRTDAPDEQD